MFHPHELQKLINCSSPREKYLKKKSTVFNNKKNHLYKQTFANTKQNLTPALICNKTNSLQKFLRLVKIHKHIYIRLVYRKLYSFVNKNYCALQKKIKIKLFLVKKKLLRLAKIHQYIYTL